MDRRTHGDYSAKMWVVQISMPIHQNIVVIDDFDLHIFQFKIYVVIFCIFLSFIFSQQPRHGLAYQWLEIF